MSEPSRWYWLSFADEESLGVAIVQGDDIVSATRRAHELGINPGGQVMGMEIPTDKEPLIEGYTDRLISPEEAIDVFNGKRLRELDPDKRAYLDRNASRICEEHNSEEELTQ